MLYMCFLEIVRQISSQCKEQALMLVKLWHSYFDQYADSMRKSLYEVNKRTHKVSSLLDSLTQKYAQVLDTTTSRDLEYVALIDKYDKSLELLEVVSKSLHDERLRTRRLEQEMADLTDNFSILMPNHARYYKDRRLQTQLMKYTIADACGTWGKS